MTSDTPYAGSDGTALLATDSWLAPYADILRARYARLQAVRAEVDQDGGLLGTISQGHRFFGFTRGNLDDANGIWYREWAPGAYGLFLCGDFNGWNRASHPLTRDEWGIWSVFLPDIGTQSAIEHGSNLKVYVAGDTGAADRIPAYIRRVFQDPETLDFAGQYWMPAEPYIFTSQVPVLPDHQGLRIYEAHVGMALEDGRVGSFAEFTHDVLPRVIALGYDAIQLMAVAEHPYYGSFGYHVSSFYAVSSRFGTPEDLKRLVDAAHAAGILVLLDLVHSHAVKNTAEGLNQFDGTDHQYFHAGARGRHAAWDSLVFDYSKYEVRRFLLSNIRFWLEEFQVDGFRFDGVTSMLYRDHGIAHVFSSYEDYFGGNVDGDALTYLQLATELTHRCRHNAITIAEDVSGMPGIARRLEDGGIGFDYRLAMGIADYWVRLVKETPDEAWNLGQIYREMLNRRFGEKHIAYVESHDQALVGDKTLAFRLMDQEMYWHMGRHDPNLTVERGVALLKLIRLITFALGGEGWLNFMGNEFGHPEWVDFPREGNNFSYHHARRQWSLADDPALRYSGLNAFDKSLNALDVRYRLLSDLLIEQLTLHEDTRQLVFRRGPLVFAFNFHATESYADLRIPIPDAADYQVVLNTDDTQFAGYGRVAEGIVYPISTTPMYSRGQSALLYLPSRSAQVLAPIFT